MHILLTILLMATWHGTAFAAVTCDSPSSSTTEADPQMLSYAVGTTSTSNRVVVVATTFRHEGGDINGVTFNGGAMAQIGSTVINTTPNPDVGAALWIITGVSSGTFPISADWNGVLTTSTVTAYTCYGVDQVNPSPPGLNGGASNNAATSVSVGIPSEGGGLVIDAVAVQSIAAAPTEGAGQSQLVCQANNGTNLFSCGSIKAGAASVTMGWSAATNGYWALAAASLRAASPATSRHRPLVVVE